MTQVRGGEMTIAQMSNEELAAAVYEALGWGKPPDGGSGRYTVLRDLSADGNWYAEITELTSTPAVYAKCWRPVPIDGNSAAKVRQVMRTKGWEWEMNSHKDGIAASFERGQATETEWRPILYRHAAHEDESRATFEAALMALGGETDG